MISMKRLRRCAAVAASMCVQAQVQAQPQVPPVPATASSAIAEPTPQSITVTGQRPREYSDTPIKGYKADGTSALGFELELQQAPATVSVLSADFLKDAGAKRLGDALNLLPGMGIGDNGGTPREGILIRGYTAQPTVNGIPQAVTSRPKFTLVNIERVEVIKGIAGVEGNVDDFGGTIDLVTKKPQRERAQRIEIGAGDYKQWRAVFDATGALALGGNLQYRFIASAEQEAIWRAGRPARNPRYEFYPSLNWDYAPGSNVAVEYQWIRWDDPLDRGGLYIEGAGFAGNFTPRSWSIHQRGDRQEQRFQQIDFTWNHRFADWLAFKLNAQKSRNRELSTGFRNGDTEGAFLFQDDGITWNGVGRQIPIFVDDAVNRYDSDGVTAELRARFDAFGTRHQTKLALARSEGSSIYAYGGVNAPLGFLPLTSNTIDLFAPDNDQRPNIVGLEGPFYPYFRDIADKRSLALQWLGQWTPRLRTLVGVRRETTDRLFGDFGASEEAIGTPPFGDDERGLKSRALRLGASFDVVDDLTLYATLGDGRFAQAALARDGSTISQPKLVRNLEAGVKWSFADGKALATLAAFQLRERNLLASDCLADEVDCQFEKLVGGRRVRGVELDVRGTVAQALQVGGGLALQQARILESPSGFTGNRFSNTPRTQATLFAKYGWSAFGLPQLETSAGVVYVGDRQGNSGNTITLPAYTLVNLGATWAVSNDISLSFNVDNLLDKTYYTAMQDNDSAASDQVGVGERRLMHFALEWKFR
jgi:iron complex outermembrane recepter protein